jgi:Sulfotransferase family
MISHSHKVVFVHVPKVAGQSIEHMFLQQLGLDWENRESLLLRKKEAHERGPERLAHLTAEQYLELGYIEREKFEGYFKFSFVRDPYKRVFSFYNFLGYSRIVSLRTFIKEVLPIKLKQKDFFFLSQYDYLYNREGKLLVDYVGRLENIKEDIQKVINQIGMDQVSLPHVNKSKGEWRRAIRILLNNPTLVTRLNFGNDRKSFDEQFDQELKNLVSDMYAQDFEAFQYKK